jgi:hypothetical protein
MLIAWTVWLSPWDWTGDDWLGLTFFVLLFTAIIGLRQVREAQKLRIEQARPFVIIDFHAWSNMIELKIKNTGRTLARDVRFTFDKPLETSTGATDARGKLMELNIFKNGIPSLAPDKEITLFFDTFVARVDAALPMTYNVTVDYRDPAGRKYSEPMLLDLDTYFGTGGITRHDIHDVHRRLEELVKEIKKWTAWPGGIKTMTANDIKEHYERLVQEDEERAAAASPEKTNGTETSSSS